MLLLELIAEEKIREAVARGEFDNLPGAGRPIAEEAGMEFVAPEMRMAYRILKNAGYVPREVQLRREIADTGQLLSCCEFDSADHKVLHHRLHFLIQKLAESGHNTIPLQNDYLTKLSSRMG